MPRNTIEPDSTFESIVSLLDNAELQLRQLLATMLSYRRQHGNAHVRIGVTGEGKQPYYKVFSVDGDARETVHGTFYGPTRQDDSWEPQNGAWSSRSSDVAEIQELLGRVRGFRGRSV